MSYTSTAALARCALAAALVFSAGASRAETYLLSQSGFQSGGSLTGWFEGTDTNEDGQIVFWLGEVTGFSITFSGNASVPAFQLGLFDLTALTYDVGTSFIGDSNGATLYTEGVSAVPRGPGPGGYRYDTGYLPAFNGGAGIFGPNGALVESTAQLLAVSSVPELASHWLWVAGALLLTCRARRAGS